MATKTPSKRTARMTPITSGTKRRAAIEKRQRATTLITGGTGFLGSHLVHQLIDEGAKNIRVMATSIPDWLVDHQVAALSLDGTLEILHRIEQADEVFRILVTAHVDTARV